MGKDACIVAVKARKQFYFDRLYNFKPYPEKEDGIDARWEELVDRSGVGSDLEVRAPEFSAEEIRYICTRSAKIWDRQQPERNRRVWLEQIVGFTTLFPGDTFKILDWYQPDFTDVAESLVPKIPLDTEV